MITATRARSRFDGKPPFEGASHAPPAKTSDLLRGVLAKNPDVETFTIGGILDAIGADKVEASLILFSVPSMLPVPGAPGFSPMTAGGLGGHFATGRQELKLPKAILGKSVPRRSLAVAVHAVLPVLEFAEKAVRPRLAWVSHPICKRILGLLLFILAATIAFPAIGLDPLHAMSVFVISLGLAEKDGLAILLGVVVGVASLALLAASSLTLRAVRAKVGVWVRRLARRLGFNALASYCERRGWVRLAGVLRFQLPDILLSWDPERRAAERAASDKAASAADPAARRDIASARPRPSRSAPGPKAYATPTSRPGRSVGK